MSSILGRSLTRRDLIRVGGLATLATALSPALRLAHSVAHAEICNPDSPGTPAEAFDALIAGNDRWSTGKQTHPDEGDARRTCLANNKQTPFVSIISCSDSRVPPELLFDQGLGELFVARVAGNVATGKLFESLLYGTGVLGTPLIFVLGHSACGAVSTAVERFPRHQLEFVSLIFPAVAIARHKVKQAGGDPNDPAQVIPVATDENVKFTVNRLTRKFKKQINAGTLAVAGGVYDLGTQEVNVLVSPFG